MPEASEVNCAENFREPCGVIGTALERTSYEQFTLRSQMLCSKGHVTAVDFTNTQIVTMRRHDPLFREVTSSIDYFVPDSTPLIWCFRLKGDSTGTRTYGPAFMRYCILNSPIGIKHYFLGGSQECLRKLEAAFRALRPEVNIVGAKNGYFNSAEEASIVEEINNLNPDFVWIGLGTPKQQEWIYRNKNRIRRGVLFAVGFAFDVNAGTKPDAPKWMHSMGLTWLYRLCSEPRRLFPRYVKYNTLFILYLLSDFLRARAWSKS